MASKRRVGPDEGITPVSDLINREGFWAVGGVAITTRYMPDKSWRVGLFCDKRMDQDVTGGHEETFRLLGQLIPNSKLTIVRMDEEEKLQQRYRIGGDWEDISMDRFRRILKAMATPKPLRNGRG